MLCADAQGFVYDLFIYRENFDMEEKQKLSSGFCYYCHVWICRCI